MNSRVPEVAIDQTEMRKQVLARFAGLFERQVRARQYAQNVNALVQATHAEVKGLLQHAVDDLELLALDDREKNRMATKLAAAVGRFSRLDATLDCIDPVNFCSGIIPRGNICEHDNGRRNQTLDSQA